jgi:signal transduction histidine kinase
MTLVTVIVLGVGSMMVFSERRLLVQDMRHHHDQTVQRLANVCAESYLQNDFILLNYLGTLQQERGFLGAAFINAEGIVRVHSDPKQLGRSVGDMMGDYTGEILDLSAPVTASGKPVGSARLFLSQTEIDSILRQSLKVTLKRIGIILLIALILGFLAAFLLARMMVRPIQRIVQAMRAVSHGRREPFAFPHRQDELGWMAQELNVTIKKLKEVDEMKQDFAAGITHDLKSPLNVIRTIQSMLLKSQDQFSKNRIQDYYLTIQNNANRLMELIEDLLTTARIETGGEQTENRLFDIRSVIEEAAQQIRPLAEEKKIRFRVSAPDKPVYVWADKDNVFQILSNLISNALKYTERGSVDLRVQDGTPHVEVRVIDTGSGIPDKDKQSIFKKFQRSPSNQNKAKGTGLGLYIVKGLVEAQRGTVAVADNPKGGTIFTFTLPKTEKI